MKKLTLSTTARKRLLIAIGALFLVYLVMGFVGTPLIVRHILEKKVSVAIDRTIRVEKVKFNPFTLTLDLKNFHIKEPDGGAFVSLDEVLINLESLSILKRGLVVKKIGVVNPDIVLVRQKEGAFNFSRLPEKENTQKPKEDEKESGPFYFSISEADISGAAITFSDQVASVEHRIENLNIHLTQLSAFPKDMAIPALFKLAGRFNGADVAINGRSLCFDPSLETDTSIHITGLKLPKYAPYLTLPDNMTFLSAVLGLKTQIAFQKEQDTNKLHLLSGNLNLSNVQIGNGKGAPVLKIPQYDMTVGDSELLAGKVNITNILIDSPEIFLTRLSSGQFDLPKGSKKKGPAGKTDQKGEGDEKPRISLSLEKLTLTDGKVAYVDHFTPEKFSTTLSDLNFDLNGFSLEKENKTTFDFNGKTESNEGLALTGDFSLFPLVLDGKLALDQVKPAKYEPYYKTYSGVHVDQGNLDFETGFLVDTESENPDIKLSDIVFEARQFKFSEKEIKKHILSVDKLMIKGAADITGKSVEVDNIGLNGGQLFLRREKTGEINLLNVVERGTVVKTTARELKTGKAVSEKTPDDDNWRFLVKKASIDPFDLFFEDLMPERSVKMDLEKINLTVNDISNRKGVKGDVSLSLSVNQAGRIAVKGPVALVPPKAEVAVDIKELGIPVAQPYLDDKTGMVITDGFIDTKGKLSFKMDGEKEPDVDYAGTFAINSFNSIDRAKANDFLKWDSLYLDGLDVGTAPNHVVINDVSLSNFYARVIVHKDGTVNLKTVIGGDEENAKEETKAEVEKAPDPESQPEGPSAFDLVRVNTVTLQGGEVNLTDEYVPFGFNADILDIGGSIKGLASIREEKADVQLKGRLENHSPVEISGKINPLIENTFLDLKFIFRDIEMSPLSPYSGRYLGKMLEKGKLTFELDYLLENRHLNGKNRVYLSQLELGEPVDSPDATNLPVDLAIALLKDREGNIDINLPVEGMIDDPEFRIGGVILTMLKNLIVKIITSPFAALGGMVGGGEELGYLEFPYGSADLDQAGNEKLDKLVEILLERPKLSIEIDGNIDAKNDRQGLHEKKFEDLLKREKRKTALRGGSGAQSLDQIVIEGEEREKWLSAAFHAADFPKPRDSAGKIKQLPPQEMEKLLMASIEVTDNDMRLLAVDRAQAAKNHILTSGKVEPARVYVVEKGAGAVSEAEGDEAEPKNRVVFKLK